MKVSFKKILNYSFVVLVIASFSSCVKKDFDTPPTGGVDPVMTGTYTTIAGLKTLYAGTPVKITSDIYISGVVIADDQSGNFYKELVIQDSTGGISINLDQSNYYTTYKIGRRVFVKCNGLTIGAYANLIQIGSGVDNTGSLTRIASTLISKYLLPGSYYHYVTPRTIHIGDTLPNVDAYISKYQNTLIKIDTAEFAEQDTTFADGLLKQDINLTIKDCNGKSIFIRSSGYSNFATSIVPNGNGSIIAVLQIYNSFGANAYTDFQIKIRDLSDLTMVNPLCGAPPPGAFYEGFSSQVAYDPISIAGWLNASIAGTEKWEARLYNGNTYAQASAFGTGLSSMETWLITPGLNLSVFDTLTFESAQAFWVHNGLSVWISTNFDGTNVSAATWIPLSCTLAGSTDTDYALIPSGTVPLTAFSGTGYIGFKYNGSDTGGQTTTYQIDNVIVH